MADFLGIGPEIWGLFGLIFLAVFYSINKSRVRDVPVKVLWGLKTHAAYLLSAKEDIAGVYIDVFKGRRAKKLTTLGKAGLPLEVSVVPDKARAYLIKKENGEPGVTYDVHMGGLQRMRLYGTLEGTGQTTDFFSENDGDNRNMHQTIVNEELGAAQALIRIIKEEVGIPTRTFLMIFGAGAGLMGSAIFALLFLTGHIH